MTNQALTQFEDASQDLCYYLKHSLLSLWRAVLLIAQPRSAQLQPQQKGEGRHRIHRHRLAKVIILHYLLLAPGLSGTPLTVSCAQHTAPFTGLERGQAHECARSTAQGTAFVMALGKNTQHCSYLRGSRRETKEWGQIIKQCIVEQEVRWGVWAVK